MLLYKDRLILNTNNQTVSIFLPKVVLYDRRYHTTQDTTAVGTLLEKGSYDTWYTFLLLIATHAGGLAGRDLDVRRVSHARGKQSSLGSSIPRVLAAAPSATTRYIAEHREG